MKIILPLFLVAALCTLSVQAQVLNKVAPVRQEVDVTQFGYKPDREFVICANAADCDAPLRKTLDTTKPPPVSSVSPAVAPIPHAQPESTMADVSHAKQTPKRLARHHRIRTKRHQPCACHGSHRIPSPGSATRRE